MKPLKKTLVVLSLALLAGVFLLPYLWMLGSAFKSRSELFSYVLPVSWKTFIPVKPTLDNFTTLLFELGFTRTILNTLGLSAITVLGSVLLCSMAAFALSLLDFPGRKLAFFVIMFTMMVPFEARMLPTFLVVQDIGLSNTFTALYLPWLADAFLIFLFSNHFAEIPFDLYHAAVIDGCPHTRIYSKIMLPNITPALVSGALIKFFFAWDSYVWPLIILRNNRFQVLGVAIANLFTDQSIAWELIFSSALLSTVPVVIIFILLQRYYIAGMTSGGIKE